MSAREHLGTLVQGIRADIARCDEMLPLLTEQQRLLARQDAAGLNGVGERIAKYLQGLETSAGARTHALEGLGLTPSAEGIDLLVKKLPANVAAQLKALWHQLQTALAKCQRLNERNGELLAEQRVAISEITGNSLSRYGEPR